MQDLPDLTTTSELIISHVCGTALDCKLMENVQQPIEATWTLTRDTLSDTGQFQNKRYGAKHPDMSAG